MDTCVLILLTTMRMATGVDACNLPTYCSVSDGKNVCVKREAPNCTNPAPSQSLYTCTKKDGSTYQWNGGPTKPVKKKVK